jgi:hypothetical protein
LHLHERLQDAVVIVLEAGLIAIEEGERTAVAHESFEGDGEAVMFGQPFEAFTEALFLIEHALLEEPGFDAGVAGETPTGGGELMDEIGLGLGVGAEVIEIAAELGLILVGGFIEEDDGAGGESVDQGIAGGGLLTGAGGRASGFGAVGTGGGEFAGGGRHGISRFEYRSEAAWKRRSKFLSSWAEMRGKTG